MEQTLAAEIAIWEEKEPGWLQTQRCSGFWLLEKVREGRLQRLDLSVWFAISSRTQLSSGVAHAPVESLASDLGCRSWEKVAVSVQRLQSVGALLRIRPGYLRINPFLLRAGGPGQHSQLFEWWFLAWDRRDENPRARKQAYDREGYAQLTPEQRARKVERARLRREAERQGREPRPA